MTDFQITCVRKDDRGVILEVGIANSGIYQIVNVVNHIHQHPQDVFYTIRNNNPAKVYAKQHHVSKRWFLTTEPDSMYENNLDFLPLC
ncbi:DUF3892 domain-containing protein [Candidatus Nitrosocosmicus arcticus]|uniref:DUF3892 domain-containing protein n=1 Tax=Candidatus Nitrosocosmicus arcticus TaxID=2035267 RepID=A0A557SZ74_9ARCH|nr:DUF3892 domain-containing protein [Candidatus Nitrosocosmicus arcticus]TVP41908.1 hypothetical protein NARC_10314 [Candidatus Nitrosocosmicus arcticus]